MDFMMDSKIGGNQDSITVLFSPTTRTPLQFCLDNQYGHRACASETTERGPAHCFFLRPTPGDRSRSERQGTNEGATYHGCIGV
jgi:hypothetical protein